MDRFDADEDGAKRALRVHDRPARRAGNLQAALAAWAVSLPYYLTVALLLTTGLRQPSAAPAITALFLGLFLFNAVPALTGWGHSHIGGPVTSTVLTYAALLAHHQALVDREPFALAALVVACGVASAIFQILFALTGTTRLLRFVPYPVITSLSLGGMVLVFLSQLPILAGTSNWTRIGKLEWDATSATLLVAAATFAILWLVPRIWPNVPASILALVVASFLGVLFTRGGYPLGFLEKTPPVTDALEPALGGIEHLPRLIADLDWPFLLISALTVALLNTFNSLMNASLLDEPLGEAPDDRRLLLAQGAGNLAAAAAGGITGCSTRFTTLAFLDAGGRSRRHAGLWAASMVPLLALAATALSFVPLVAVSVILLRMAFVSLDRWVVRLPIHLTTGPKRQRAVGWANVFALALMTMVIVVGGFAFGVLAGVAISLAWFVVRVGTLRLGEVLHGDAIRSKMVRSSAHLETLAKHGREIAIVQLKGPLYFGSAFRVLEATEKAMAGARWIVLDLRRVNDVDLSGARAIERIRTTLADSGRRLSIVIGPEGAPSSSRPRPCSAPSRGSSPSRTTSTRRWRRPRTTCSSGTPAALRSGTSPSENSRSSGASPRRIWPPSSPSPSSGSGTGARRSSTRGPQGTRSSSC